MLTETAPSGERAHSAPPQHEGDRVWCDLHLNYAINTAPPSEPPVFYCFTGTPRFDKRHNQCAPSLWEKHHDKPVRSKHWHVIVHMDRTHVRHRGRVDGKECIICGTNEDVIRHHPYGRKRAPYLVVPMCRTCENACHGRSEPRPTHEDATAAWMSKLPLHLIAPQSHDVWREARRNYPREPRPEQVVV